MAVIEGLDVRWNRPKGWRSLPVFDVRESFTIAHVHIPVGFKSDGATVPVWARWLFPPIDRYFPAAIAHDYLLKSEHITREIADKTFRVALRESGISKIRQWVMYKAVRLNSLSKKL